jgi:hypothetical protein
MTRSNRRFIVGGFLGCLLMIPEVLPAAPGCTTGQLQGVYNAQVTNIGFQAVVALPPTTSGTITVIGLASNPNSLSGSLPGLGRYFFDGTGNIVGVSAASSTSPAMSTNVGTYTVNADCSGSLKLTSGASYDVFLATSGTQIQYVRTDPNGNAEAGILRRAGSCVTLSSPSNFAFEVGGSTKQTPPSGTSAPYPYSAAGTLSLSGSGAFTMAQSLVTSAGVQRSTSSGSYTVGGDCSVTLKFDTTTPGASSTGFVAPTSFRALMVDATTGMLIIQPDANTSLAGTLIAQ